MDAVPDVRLVCGVENWGCDVFGGNILEGKPPEDCGTVILAVVFLDNVDVPLCVGARPGFS